MLEECFNIFIITYAADLEWKVIYVGSAEDKSRDQILEEVLVGPVPTGTNKFVLETEPPDASRIPTKDILGVTVLLVTCSYRDQEFSSIGYYVNNEYAEEYDPDVGPPMPLDMSKVRRQILADKPRVTKYPIDWGSGVIGGGNDTNDAEENVDGEAGHEDDTSNLDENLQYPMPTTE